MEDIEEVRHREIEKNQLLGERIVEFKQKELLLEKEISLEEKKLKLSLETKKLKLSRLLGQVRERRLGMP